MNCFYNFTDLLRVAYFLVSDGVEPTVDSQTAQKWMPGAGKHSNPVPAWIR